MVMGQWDMIEYEEIEGEKDERWWHWGSVVSRVKTRWLSALPLMNKPRNAMSGKVTKQIQIHNIVLLKWWQTQKEMMMFTMLEAVELPASIADLTASLADVNADTFPLKKNIKNIASEEKY